MAEIVQTPIRSVYKDDSIVISNVKSKIDNTTTSYTVVNTWHDSTPMDDTKVDEFGIYSKYKPTGEYLRENKPQWGELFLEVDTVAELRDMTPYNQFLIKIGYFKGVRLSGYYVKGDTPGPIDYYISNSVTQDNGANVIRLGNIVLEHIFKHYCHGAYWGIFPDEIDRTDKINQMFRYCSINRVKPQFYDGAYIVDGEYDQKRGITILDNLILDFTKAILWKIKATRGGNYSCFTFLKSKNVYAKCLNVRGDRGEHLAPNNEPYLELKGQTAYSTGQYVVNQTKGLIVVNSGVTVNQNSTSAIVGEEYLNGTVTFRVVELVGEWGWGVRFIEAQNVEIDHIIANNFWGDGVYFGKSDRGKTNINVVINKIYGDNNRRQGISIITGKNILIRNANITRTQGTAPMAGVDIEPNHNDDVLENIVIDNLVTEGNSGGGFIFVPINMDSTTPPVSITLNNHKSKNEHGFLLRGRASARIFGKIINLNPIYEKSHFEAITLTNVINYPDVDIIKPYIIHPNNQNAQDGIDVGIRVAYTSQLALQAGDYETTINIQDPTVIGKDNTKWGLYCGVIGSLGTPIKNVLISSPNIQNALNYEMYYAGYSDINDGYRKLERVVSSDGTQTQVVQYRFHKTYRNTNSSLTHFLVLNPHYNKVRFSVVNDNSNVLGVLFYENIGGIVGITSAGTARFETSQKGAFIELQPYDGALNLWNITNGSGIWRLIENGITTQINLNGRPIAASSSNRGGVNQSVNIANASSPNATDLNTAIALINELKTKLNAKLDGDRSSGQQSLI